MKRMMTLAEYLKITRTRQEDFAASIGVTQATISRLVRGVVSPSIDMAAAIKAATNDAVGFEAWVTKPARLVRPYPNKETSHDLPQTDASSDAA